MGRHKNGSNNNEIESHEMKACLPLNTNLSLDQKFLGIDAHSGNTEKGFKLIS